MHLIHRGIWLQLSSNSSLFVDSASFDWVAFLTPFSGSQLSIGSLLERGFCPSYFPFGSERGITFCFPTFLFSFSFLLIYVAVLCSCQRSDNTFLSNPKYHFPTDQLAAGSQQDDCGWLDNFEVALVTNSLQIQVVQRQSDLTSLCASEFILRRIWQVKIHSSLFPFSLLLDYDGNLTHLTLEPEPNIAGTRREIKSSTLRAARTRIIREDSSWPSWRGDPVTTAESWRRKSAGSTSDPRHATSFWTTCKISVTRQLRFRFTRRHILLYCSSRSRWWHARRSRSR